GPAELRPADRVQLSQAEARLRPAPDRRAHRPGSGHLAAAGTLEPAGLDGHPRLLAGDPDRSIAGLRPATLSGGLRAAGAPRAAPRDRRVRQPDRDGADARPVTLADLRRPPPHPPVRAR